MHKNACRRYKRSTCLITSHSHFLNVTHFIIKCERKYKLISIIHSYFSGEFENTDEPQSEVYWHINKNKKKNQREFTVAGGHNINFLSALKKPYVKSSKRSFVLLYLLLQCGLSRNSRSLYSGCSDTCPLPNQKQTKMSLK